MGIRRLLRSTRTVWLVTVCIVLSPQVALFGNFASVQSVAECDGLPTVFSGFILVNQAACKRIEYRSHEMKPLSPPGAFQVDVCYVFLLPNISGQPAYELLEKRLRKIGAHITHSPSASHDMVQLMSGGPLFHIEFQNGREQGAITTVQDPIISADPELRKEWKAEDFVLLMHHSEHIP